MTTADDAAAVRADIAQLVGYMLRAEGYRYVTPSACYAVADALIARPGLLVAGSAVAAVRSARAASDGVP